MNRKEAYDLKRKNFIENSMNIFRFICKDYGYLDPVHSFSQHPNGVITSDSLEYRNGSIDRLVVIYNAYHPNDYGFEVQFYCPSISTLISDKVMVYHVLKEDQDIDQSYLKKAARHIQENYQSVLLGNDWLNST